MKKTKTLLTWLLVALMLVSVFGVTKVQAAEELTYADGTTLRIAAGYNNRKNALTFEAEIAGEGITLADGKTYHTGDLKPTC